METYYAASDAYVGPSLDDAFAQPPAEAMACGLPVITSRQNGGSEIITHSYDGLVLDDPADSTGLADMIRNLIADPVLRNRLGAAASETAREILQCFLDGRQYPHDFQPNPSMSAGLSSGTNCIGKILTL